MFMSNIMHYQRKFPRLNSQMPKFSSAESREMKKVEK